MRNPRPLPKRLSADLSLCRMFPDRVMFLDVETTGLSHYYDETTIIGWSLGGQTRTIIRGQETKPLIEDCQQALALVTFNGKRFDSRFLENELPEISLPNIHIDLMYLARRVGLKGGQKAIERELDIDLRASIEEVDGFAAVLLWHRYIRGDREALASLIRYNRADIAAMGAIFDHVLARLDHQPDMFQQSTQFLPWSAPTGWFEDIPEIGPPAADLTATPSYRELIAPSIKEGSRVVGIDLTGSEKRPSGWCLLDGCNAHTAMFASDAEIIEATVRSRPTLISIDSPLSLPRGRTRVTDDDPARDSAGIMRECERELKRRGINVYPCLLPSMQRLTERGIRLAQAFREMGIPVIESYPGAAQDIMRIPRKGAGQALLAEGLSQFGINGSFETEAVKHDELDAITSAIVGAFHLVEMSEALGPEDEGPLIVPTLQRRSSPIIVGISGPIAAGKTAIASALERHGFAYTRYSLAIDEMLTMRGMELSRRSRQELGEEVHSQGRQRELSARTLSRVEGAPRIVIDGLRFPEDHAFMFEQSGYRFIHVHVVADETIRRIRYSARDEGLDFDFASSSPVEGEVAGLRRLASLDCVNEDRLGIAVDTVMTAVEVATGSVTCQSR